MRTFRRFLQISFLVALLAATAATISAAAQEAPPPPDQQPAYPADQAPSPPEAQSAPSVQDIPPYSAGQEPPPSAGEPAPSAGDQGPDPSGRVARLGYLTGSVSVQPQGTGDWVQGSLNRPLTNADNVWADKDSRAELNLGTGVMRIEL